MKKVAALTTLLLALTGCVSLDQEASKQTGEWSHLTKEHFSQTTTVKDDVLETVASFDTQRGFQYRGVLAGSNDEFLRAFVDKKTGKVTYQLYQIIRYIDSGWHYYNQINYLTQAGTQTASALVISRDVDCAGSTARKRGCEYEEHVSIPLDEAVVRWLASSYTPEKAVTMAYRVEAQAGEPSDERMLSAEAAGLVDRVDAYLVAKGFANKR